MIGFLRLPDGGIRYCIPRLVGGGSLDRIGVLQDDLFVVRIEAYLLSSESEVS